MKKKLNLKKIKLESFTTSAKNVLRGGCPAGGGNDTFNGTGLCTGCTPIQCF